MTHPVPSVGQTQRGGRSIRRLALSLCVTAGLLATPLATAQAAHPGVRPRALTPVTLVLKWVPQAQFAGYYVGLMPTFDDEGADGAQGCCAWRDNRLVGRPKAGLKGSLASSSVCGRRPHYR